MTPAQKAKLQVVYDSLATPEERASLRQELLQRDTNQSVLALEEKAGASAQAALEAISQVRADVKREQNVAMRTSMEAITAFKDSVSLLAKKLDDIGTLLKKNPDTDMSGFFKDFGVQIAQWSEQSKNSSELIRNLKWNASQQLRNRNGSPINPSVDLFNIGTVDDIEMTYTGSNITTVTYKANGIVTAVLALTYSGSNLIEVERTS